MSIEQLKNGRFRVRLEVGGKRTSGGTFATRAEAERAEASNQTAALTSGPTRTLAKLGGAWLDRRELDGGRDVEGERRRWRRHVLGSLIADVALEELSPTTIAAWIDELRAKRTSMRHATPRPLSPKTIREIIGLAKLALDAADVRPNPITESRKAVRAATRRRGAAATVEPWSFLDADEQAALLGCEFVPEAERLVIAFAMLTGLRQGEQANLHLADLHVGDEAHVFVRFGSKGQPPKNGKTRRVYLSAVAVRIAKRWLEVLPTWAPFNPLGLVFPSSGGARLGRGKHALWRGTTDAVGKRHKVDLYKAALRAAGIERPVRWHDLRHTCASSLISGWWGRRWTLEEVKAHLGHTSLASTMRYAHMGESAIKRAIVETSWDVDGDAARAESSARGTSKQLEESLATSRYDSSGSTGTRTRGQRVKSPARSEEVTPPCGTFGSLLGRLAPRALAALAAHAAGDPFAAEMMAALLREALDESEDLRE